MRTAKELALIGVYTALLIGGQFALSGIAGVEIVTVLLAAFCYCFGVRIGVTTATAFSILRCFLFGFFPTVIILYLVYYNLFAVVFGLLGKKFDRRLTVKSHAILCLTAVGMTAFFTALDDVITPLFYGYSFDVARAYAAASLFAAVPQMLCALVTVLLILPILVRVFARQERRL